jgi:hypothetical protein
MAREEGQDALQQSHVRAAEDDHLAAALTSLVQHVEGHAVIVASESSMKGETWGKVGTLG